MINNLKESILFRESELLKVKAQAEAYIMQHPNKDRIRININRGYIEYYLISPHSSPNGKYLKKNDLSIASNILQIDYLIDLINNVNQELVAINLFKKNYPNLCYEDLYNTLSVAKQKLVIPINETNDIFLAKWMDSHPDYLNTYPFSGEQYTILGNPVRSKSEKNIADALIRYNVPFKYECEMMYKGRKHYPDFTCLNQRTRRTWIWDHSGLITNYRYATDFCERNEMYENLGYYYGDGLIVTFECEEKNLSSKTIDATIKRYLL